VIRAAPRGWHNDNYTEKPNSYFTLAAANFTDYRHNLGLNHAGANGKSYADLTGYMGASYAKTTSPQMCFNAQNHWKLAWYRKRAIEIDPSVSQTLRIAPFVHFDKIAQASVYVLVKVKDLYFQVNQSEEFNRGTAQMKNQLVVVQENNGKTDLLAGLDLTSQSYAIENFKGSGSRLVLQVCDVVEADMEMPYHMVVSVGYTWSLCSNDSSSFGSSTKKVQSFSTVVLDIQNERQQSCKDDSESRFAIEETIGMTSTRVFQPCEWLASNPKQQGVHCAEGNEAYEICPRSCGRCSHSDTPEVVTTSTFDKADVTTFSVGKEKKESSRSAEVGDFVSSKVSESSVFYGGSQTSFRVVGKNGD
jgi:hypothetical protein